MTGRPLRVCFLYIAQGHQVLHSLSAAVELARRCPDVAVDVAATSAQVLDLAQQLAQRLGGAPIGWRRLGPRWLSRLAGPEGVAPKLPMLATNARNLRRYDVVVTPERTTAALRLFGPAPKLVYTQHGAGDRGGPFEPRLRQFDLVFSAGAKQRDRMIAEGLVAPAACPVVGYPKFDLVDRLARPLPKLFDEARPTVLYNPHFDRRLGSWTAWGPQILRAFSDQRDFNLIFAPHLRLFGGHKAEEIAALAPFRDHPAIHIDLGDTMAAIDMTYTRMADVYLGDVSSQVYEFIRTPRPCLFLNPAHGAWVGEESFAHWKFGPVIDDLTDVVAAVVEARSTHGAWRDAQVRGFRHTFDETATPASVRAAAAIARLVGGELDLRDTLPPRAVA
jgi:hypothetical protein